MTDTERSDFWWNSVTGPRAAVFEATAALRDGSTVVLESEDRMNWPLTMRTAVDRGFKDRLGNSDILTTVVDGSGCRTETEAGRKLLELFGSPRLRSGYRSRSRSTLQEYMAKNDVLRGRLIWVQVRDPEESKAWLDFARGWTATKAAAAGLVLETGRLSGIRHDEERRIHFIDLDDRIHVSDLNLFLNFDLGTRCGYTDAWREYAAAAAASVCFPDAELGAQLLENVDLKLQIVQEGLSILSQEESGRDFGPEHALTLYREGNDDEIDRRLWNAQIQTLFPRIEMERIAIIRHWYDNVDRALRENELAPFGERIKDPEDAELGLLCYAMSHWHENGPYLLYLPDAEVRDRLRFLLGCRNRLAHLDVCAPAVLDELFAGRLYERD